MKVLVVGSEGREHELVKTCLKSPIVNKIIADPYNEGIITFGPNKEAAQFEGSKFFAKAFLKNYGAPTAEGMAFTQAGAALDYIKEKISPYNKS